MLILTWNSIISHRHKPLAAVGGWKRLHSVCPSLERVSPLGSSPSEPPPGLHSAHCQTYRHTHTHRQRHTQLEPFQQSLHSMVLQSIWNTIYIFFCFYSYCHNYTNSSGPYTVPGSTTVPMYLQTVCVCKRVCESVHWLPLLLLQVMIAALLALQMKFGVLQFRSQALCFLLQLLDVSLRLFIIGLQVTYLHIDTHTIIQNVEKPRCKCHSTSDNLRAIQAWKKLYTLGAKQSRLMNYTLHCSSRIWLQNVTFLSLLGK